MKSVQALSVVLGLALATCGARAAEVKDTAAAKGGEERPRNYFESRTGAGIRTRAVRSGWHGEEEGERETAPGTPENPIFLPVIDNELWLGARRPVRQRWEITGPGGAYYRRERYFREPYYLWYAHPAEGADRVYAFVGGASRHRTYYYGAVLPPAHGTYYFPSNREARRQVVLDTPTAEGAGREIDVPPRPTGREFRSRLSPMLGGGRRVGLHFSVGEARLRRGDFAGAALAFERSVGTRPEDPVPKVALALALVADRQYAGAAHILRRGLRGMADWNAIRMDPADALGTEQRYRRTLGQLQAAAANRPEDGDVRLLLAFVRFAAGDLDRAAEELQGAIDSGVTDPLVEGLLLEIRARLSAEDAGEEVPSADRSPSASAG